MGTIDLQTADVKLHFLCEQLQTICGSSGTWSGTWSDFILALRDAGIQEQDYSMRDIDQQLRVLTASGCITYTQAYSEGIPTTITLQGQEGEGER